MTSERSEHPCKGMTAAQRQAFERIAINQVPSCKPQTIKALLEAGLIEQGQGEIRRDALGPYTIPNYFVPIAIHAQWCRWCGERAADGWL